MPKIDIHIHLGLGESFVTTEQLVAKAEGLAAYLNELGITQAVLMSMGESHQKSGNNLECETVSHAFPSMFRWMCNIDDYDIDSIPARLSRYKQQGALGVGEIMINRRLDDQFIRCLFDAAQSLKLPVLFHMSPKEGFGYGVVDLPGLPLLADALNDFPDLIVIGHSQPFWHEITGNANEHYSLRNAWGTGPVKTGGRLPHLLSHHPNLYGDLSANSGGCAIMRDEDFGLFFLERFQDQLLFGTDTTSTHDYYPLGSWLDEQCEKGRIKKETYEKITVLNARRIFML